MNKVKFRVTETISNAPELSRINTLTTVNLYKLRKIYVLETGAVSTYEQ